MNLETILILFRIVVGIGTLFFLLPIVSMKSRKMKLVTGTLVLAISFAVIKIGESVLFSLSGQAKLTEDLFGQSFQMKETFSYDSFRDFTGDGFSVSTYKLEEEIKKEIFILNKSFYQFPKNLDQIGSM